MNDRRSWFEDPAKVTRLVRVLYGLCALMFVADLLYRKHAHFGFENVFGFYAIYGFVACVTLVLAAKLLRKILMRREDYYDAPETRETAPHREDAH